MRICHGTNVTAEVLAPELVVEQLLERQLILAFQTSSILRHVEGRSAIAIRKPLDQLPEAQGVGAQPRGLRLGADPLTRLVLVQDVEVAGEVVDVGLAFLVADVVCAVVVHAVEVVAALDQGDLVGRQRGQAVAQLRAHRVWVLAKVDWVAEPRDGKLDLAVGSFDIFGVVLVPGVGPVTWLFFDLGLAIVFLSLSLSLVRGSSQRHATW